MNVNFRRGLFLTVCITCVVLFSLSVKSFASSESVEVAESPITSTNNVSEERQQSDNGSNNDSVSDEKEKPPVTHPKKETPKKTGWVKSSKDKYYYIDGVPVKNQAKQIDGITYYFDKKGKLTKSKGWFKGSDGYRRYGLGKGIIAVGTKKVGKTLYFFKSSGKLIKKGLFVSEGRTFYSKGGGKLAVGWTNIGNNAYYFYKKTGYMARNTKVGYLKIPKSGKLGKAYVLAIKKLNKHGWSLGKAYKYSYKLKYANRYMRKKNSESYAVYGFQKGYGNCYVMAATFYIQAKLLGYNVRQIEGRVDLPHSWTEIKHGKTWYVYDPNFRNETGRSGWKFKYKKKGTWRYNSYRVFQS